MARSKRAKRSRRASSKDPVQKGLAKVIDAPAEERPALAQALMREALPSTKLEDFRKVHALAFPLHDLTPLAEYLASNGGADLLHGCGPAYACLHETAGAFVLDAINPLGKFDPEDPCLEVGGHLVYEGELKDFMASENPDRQKHLLLLALYCSDVQHYGRSTTSSKDEWGLFDMLGYSEDVAAALYCTEEEAEIMIDRAARRSVANARHESQVAIDKAPDPALAAKAFDALMAGAITFSTVVDALGSSGRAIDWCSRVLKQHRLTEMAQGVEEHLAKRPRLADGTPE